ncbi:hypothetical protein Tco_0916599 [Tanacetum coccineum]
MVQKHIVDEELENLLEGNDNVNVDEVMNDTFNNQEDPGTRIKPRSDKESLKAEIDVDLELTTIIEEGFFTTAKAETSGIDGYDPTAFIINTSSIPTKSHKTVTQNDARVFISSMWQKKRYVCCNDCFEATIQKERGKNLRT